MTLAMIGCASEPSGTTFLHVSVDHSRVPGTLHVSIYFGGGATSATSIATPEILAGQAQPAAHAMSLPGHAIVQFGRDAFDGGVRSAKFDHPMYVAVAAIDDALGISGGWSGPIEHPEDASITITLDPALQPELWGTQSDGGDCVRLDTGSTTVFLNRAEDPDCDGLTGAQDTQPYTFCDPTATSGPARNACL
jgi:hypothetical protein